MTRVDPSAPKCPKCEGEVSERAGDQVRNTPVGPERVCSFSCRVCGHSFEVTGDMHEWDTKGPPWA